MGRKGALGPTEPRFKLIGERWQGLTGEWSQKVDVAGVIYWVRVFRGNQRYRQAYSNKFGYHWFAEVRSADGQKRIWDGQISKTLGARGILIDAGIVVDIASWWRSWADCWGKIGWAVHQAQPAHRECKYGYCQRRGEDHGYQS